KTSTYRDCGTSKNQVLLPRKSSPAAAKLIDMLQHVGGVLEHPVGAGAQQLVLAIAARQKADAQRMAAARRQHVPDAVTDHAGIADIDAEAMGGLDEEIGVGLGKAHLVAGDDRGYGGIDSKMAQDWTGGLHAAAGCDRPRDLGAGEKAQELAGAGKR